MASEEAMETPAPDPTQPGTPPEASSDAAAVETAATSTEPPAEPTDSKAPTADAEEQGEAAEQKEGEAANAEAPGAGGDEWGGGEAGEDDAAEESKASGEVGDDGDSKWKEGEGSEWWKKDEWGKDESGRDDWAEENKDDEEVAEPPKKKARIRSLKDQPHIIMEIPRGDGENALSAKLQELSQACGVEAEFIEEGDEEEEKEDENKEEENEKDVEDASSAKEGGDELTVGAEIEGKTGEEWLPAKVVSTSETGVTVRWEASGEEAELSRDDVRKKASSETASKESTTADASKEEPPTSKEDTWKAKEEDNTTKSAPTFAVGDELKAKYGNSWFECKVLAEPSEGKVKIQWNFDSSEEEVPLENIWQEEMAAADPEKKSEGEEEEDFLEIGNKIEAKYGEDWFEAEVRGVGDKTVRIKWDFNGEEEKVSKEDVRAKAKPQPPPPPMKLIIAGGTERGRMEMELAVMALISMKVEGHYADSRKASDDTDGLGWTVVDLANDGEYRAKVIGKKGAMRKKMMKVCGCTFDLVGNTVYIVGTGEERARAVKLLEIVQIPSGSSPTLLTVPKELQPLCSYTFVPQEASGAVLGRGRAVLNEIEDDTGALSFFLGAGAARKLIGPTAQPVDAGKEKDPPFKADDAVEASMRGQWYRATVVETFIDEDDDLMIRVRWESDGKECDLPTNRVRQFLDGEAAAERQRREALTKSKVLAILSPEVGPRKHTMLRVLEAVETAPEMQEVDIVKGWAASALKASISLEKAAAREGEEAEAMTLAAEEIEKCKEQASIPRLRAVGVAADCIVRTVGEALYCIGVAEERAQAQEYIRWWLKKNTEYEVDQREDVEKFLVPKDKVSNLTESVLVKAEADTKTFMMWDDGAALAGIEDSIRLLICAIQKERRDLAREKLTELQEIEPPEEQSWGDDKGWDEKKDWEDSKTWDDGKGESKEEDKSWEKKEEDKKDDKWWEKKDESDDSKWKKDEWGASDDKWGKSDDKKDWGGGGGSSGEEKRVHPSDKEGTAYTWDEFMAFSNNDKKKAEKMWNESKPAEDKQDSGGDKWWEKKEDSRGGGGGGWGGGSGGRGGGGGGGNGGEKRVHPSDKSGAAYSWDEFLAFANNDQKKAEKMWNEAKTAEEGWSGGGGGARGGSGGGSDEKRVHPSDKGKTAYTWDEFLAFNKGDQKKTEKMWDESRPAEESWSHGNDRDRNGGDSWSSGKRGRNDRWDDRDDEPSSKRARPWDDVGSSGSSRISSGGRYDAFSAPAPSSGRGLPSRPSSAMPDRSRRSPIQERPRPSPALGRSAFVPRRDPGPSGQAVGSRAQVSSRRSPPSSRGGPSHPSRAGSQRGSSTAAPGSRRPVFGAAQSAPWSRDPPSDKSEEDSLLDDEDDDDARVMARLEEIGMPQSVGEWCNVQDEVWGDAPPLRTGWIRIWSKSQECVYYMRVEDQHSTFEFSEAAA